MKLMELFNLFLFISLIVIVLSYLPNQVKVIQKEKVFLEEIIKNESNNSTVVNTTTYNNIVNINSYIVGLVLEWYPINSDFPDRGWIFQNTFNWLKQGDFKIIPIFPWYEYNQINEVLEAVNSVLWMGGMQVFKKEMNGNIEKFYKHILNKVEEKKLPSLLICQGFQLMTDLYAEKDILTKFNNNKGWFNPDILNLYNLTENSSNENLILSNIHKDKLYSELNYNDVINFQTKNVSFHFHEYGFSPEDFNKIKHLNENFVISSTGKDYDGKVFVNSVYHKTLPIHGVQYHPEVANNMVFKNGRGEDYRESRTISHKILKAFKKMINEYNSKNNSSKINSINDELLESLYEVSTLDIYLTEEYDTGKSVLKGYMFRKEDYPFKMLK